MKLLHRLATILGLGGLTIGQSAPERSYPEIRRSLGLSEKPAGQNLIRRGSKLATGGGYCFAGQPGRRGIRQIRRYLRG